MFCSRSQPTQRWLYRQAWLRHERPALFFAAAAALLLLFIGIHNAWDAVIYHVFVGKPEQQEAGQDHCRGIEIKDAGIKQRKIKYGYQKKRFTTVQQRTGRMVHRHGADRSLIQSQRSCARSRH